VVDETGATLWLKKIENDESAILTALGEILDLAEDVHWAVDISSRSSALLLALLTAHGQRPVYVPGRTVNRMAGAYRGEAKTDARDAYVIAETARHHRDFATLEHLPVGLRAGLLSEEVQPYVPAEKALHPWKVDRVSRKITGTGTVELDQLGHQLFVKQRRLIAIDRPEIEEPAVQPVGRTAPPACMQILRLVLIAPRTDVKVGGAMQALVQNRGRLVLAGPVDPSLVLRYGTRHGRQPQLVDLLHGRSLACRAKARSSSGQS
jgi:hypothetical protein